MRSLIVLALSVLAALQPFLMHQGPGPARHNFSDWPSTFEGKELIALPLSDKELAFAKDFPGKIGRFSDGDREIIIRWINQESRKLHPSSDCLQGAGYSVSPLPITKDSDNNQWNCSKASKAGKSLRVCERIFSKSGESFSDTSSWFWAAALGKTQGPWWAITVASRI